MTACQLSLHIRIDYLTIIILDFMHSYVASYIKAIAIAKPTEQLKLPFLLSYQCFDKIKCMPVA